MWQLIKVKDIDCTMDNSGVYVVIHRVVTTETHREYSGERVQVRADLMGQRTVRSFDDEPTEPYPIISFIGSANNVRKHLLRFICGLFNDHPAQYISTEHASYIGYELHRAETDPNYVQD